MVKIITIDGPASSGKGTVAKIIADKLGFHYLDSGAIYRALAYAVLSADIIKKADVKKQITDAEIEQILRLIFTMQLQFKQNKVYINGQDITLNLREENVGMLASNIAQLANVRAKLLDLQHGFALEPGLVTDGRDMGSVVFPQADLKIYLTSEAEVRAKRRFKELQRSDSSVKMADILVDIELRDLRDKSRETAPLGYDSSYLLLDNSNLTIDETVEIVMKQLNESGVVL